LIDMGLVRAAEIRADDIGIDAMRAFDDDGLRVSGGGNPGGAENQTRGQDEPSKIATKKMHLAQVPHSVTDGMSAGSSIDAPCKFRIGLANFASCSFRGAAAASGRHVNVSSTPLPFLAKSANRY
jgi:hypothetical protein